MDAMYYYYLRLQDFLQPRRRRFILSLQKCKRGKMMFASIHHFSRKLNSLLLCISQFDQRGSDTKLLAGTKIFTNYVFCHPQFSGVIQNIENHFAIRAKFWKNWFLLYKIGYFDNNRHRQIGVKMAQWFSIFWITPLNCGWQNT